MDLNYKASGDNHSRLRLIEQQLGERPVVDSFSNIEPFHIWCSDDTPDMKSKVWWKTTGLDSIDSITSLAKNDMTENAFVDLMVFEHNTKNTLTWFVVCSRDNIVRTFQSENDVCSYLREMIARHES